MNNKQYYHVVDALTGLRDSSPLNMTFKGALEQEFQHATSLWNRDSIRLGTLLASGLLALGYGVQWLAGLRVHAEVEFGRFLVILTLLATAWYASRSRAHKYQYWLVALNGLLATSVILSFSFHYPEPFKYIFYSVVVLVQLFVFALIRLPFNASLLIALFTYAMTNYTLLLEQMDLQVWFFLSAILLAGLSLALMIGQRIERAARENFLQARLISMERDELKHLNITLQERLASDAVTRLLNRRSFEDAVLDEWSQALQHQTKTYLVPILIQELKALNELRGNDAGDDLLRAISRAVNQCLFDSSDVAARISGCRFCVLLANASQAEVRRRFTRLKRSLANISALKDEALVSAGVSLHLEVVEVEPDSESDPRDLVDHVFQRLTPLHHGHDIRTLRARSTQESSA